MKLFGTLNTFIKGTQRIAVFKGEDFGLDDGYDQLADGRYTDARLSAIGTEQVNMDEVIQYTAHIIVSSPDGINPFSIKVDKIEDEECNQIAFLVQSNGLLVKK